MKAFARGIDVEVLDATEDGRGTSQTNILLFPRLNIHRVAGAFELSARTCLGAGPQVFGELALRLFETAAVDIY